MDADVIVVGAGLAGACAAWSLSRTAAVCVLEAERPAAGASGVAAGLVNPLMGRRARPVWRMEAALEAFHGMLADAGAEALWTPTGVLRPAADAGQAARFEEAALLWPHHAMWKSPDAGAEQYPHLSAPHGALWVKSGGAVSVPVLVKTLLDAAGRNGAVVQSGARVAGWTESGRSVRLQTEHSENTRVFQAVHVVLALGDGFIQHPALAALRLHRIKGQVARVARPAALGGVRLVPLAGEGYVVADGEALVVGSTYEHDFEDLQPSREQTRRLLAKAARMVPALADAAVLEERAGVRVTVPGTRLPMLGPVPGHRRTWVFTGLGSKGLLMAPLLAQHLSAYLQDPSRIPEDVRVRSA